MGWKYTVQIYGKHYGESEPYAFQVYWGGQSLAVALIKLWQARRLGFGLVQLECRP
jgi:hypothetical protein